MSLKLYFDEDSAESSLVHALRTRDFEVVVPREVDLSGADDVVHLRWCAEHSYVLVSHNVADFYCLHCDFMTRGEDHAGLILIRQQTLAIGEKLRRLTKLSSVRSVDDMRNRVEFLSGWGASPGAIS